jgi:hypothetical protein
MLIDITGKPVEESGTDSPWKEDGSQLIDSSLVWLGVREDNSLHIHFYMTKDVNREAAEKIWRTNEIVKANKDRITTISWEYHTLLEQAIDNSVVLTPLQEEEAKEHEAHECRCGIRLIEEAIAKGKTLPVGPKSEAYIFTKEHASIYLLNEMSEIFRSQDNTKSRMEIAIMLKSLIYRDSVTMLRA